MGIECLIIRLCIEEDYRGFEKKMAHNPSKTKANFVDIVKVPSSRKPTTKGNAVSWDLNEESLRSRSSQGNAQLWKQGYKSSYC